MLNQVLTEELAKKFKIAPLNIIREYLEMEFLHYLSQSELSENIIFYGGTALRLAYQSFRFSEDLDFLAIKDLKINKKLLAEIMRNVADNNEGVEIEEIIEKRNTLFGLLHIKNSLLKHPIRIKIEISKKKNGVKYENALISSPTSNKEAIIQAALPESIFKLKEKAIENRDMPRDWFDYWYLAQKLHQEKLIKKAFPFKISEFENDLKRWISMDNWKIIKTVEKFYEN